MPFSDRLTEVTSEAEAREIVRELLRSGASGWRRRHVEHYLPREYHYVLDEFFGNSGTPKPHGESDAGLKSLEEMVRSVGGVGYIPRLYAGLGSAGLEYEEFREIIAAHVRDSNGARLDLVGNEVLVFRGCVETKTVGRVFEKCRKELGFSSRCVEEQVLGEPGQLAPWLSGCDASILRLGAAHLLAATGHLAKLCFRAVYESSSPLTTEQVHKAVSDLSVFHWAVSEVEHELNERWYFWPVEARKYSLTSVVTDSHRDPAAVARRYLSILSESVLRHSFCGENPVVIDLGGQARAKLRVYFTVLRRSPGSTGRYLANLSFPDTGSDGDIEIDRADARLALVCGYAFDEDVFVLWDSGLYDGYSHGHIVSVSMESIYSSMAGDIGLETRNLKAGTESVVTCPPSKLLEALELRYELDRDRLLDAVSSRTKVEPTKSARRSPIATVRQRCMIRIEKGLGRTFVSISRAVFRSKDGEVVVVCLVSGEHEQGSVVVYWFGFSPRQYKVLKDAVSGYVGLACGSEVNLLLLPFRRLEEVLSDLAQTRRPDGTSHWHVLIHEQGNRLLLQRSEGLEAIDVTEFRLEPGGD